MTLKTRLTDPIGPGTPAWEASDRALDAWREYKAGNITSKRYWNRERYVVDLLRKENTSEDMIKDWIRNLRAARTAED